jgi:hypothetical protein
MRTLIWRLAFLLMALFGVGVAAVDFNAHPAFASRPTLERVGRRGALRELWVHHGSRWRVERSSSRTRRADARGARPTLSWPLRKARATAQAAEQPPFKTLRKRIDLGRRFDRVFVATLPSLVDGQERGGPA